MFSNGDDIGPGDFCDGDAAVDLVGNVEINMVGSDTCGDGEFEVLGFAEAFFCQVAWVEANERLGKINKEKGERKTHTAL